MRLRFTILFLLLYAALSVRAQTTLRGRYDALGESSSTAVESSGEEAPIDYLSTVMDARSRRDTLTEMAGLLRLVQAHLTTQDYVAVAKWLELARALAEAKADPTWRGWVRYREGVLALRLKDYERSRVTYLEAAALCGAGRDSLCYAESLEQASVLSALVEKYADAERLHGRAMPLLKRFGTEIQEAKAYNNLGIIYSLKGVYEKSIPALERAIELYQVPEQPMAYSKARNNLADAYHGVGRIQEAEQILLDCVDFNREKGFRENLLSNYMNLNDLYSEQGKFALAKDYLQRHYEIRDSLVGVETQQRIATLEAEVAAVRQQEALRAKQEELGLVRRLITIRTLTLGALALLLAGGLLLWRRRARRKQAQLDEHRVALAYLVKLLKASAQLSLLSKVVSAAGIPPTEAPADTDEAPSPVAATNPILTQALARLQRQVRENLPWVHSTTPRRLPHPQ